MSGNPAGEGMGPACRELHRHLKGHRRRLPPILRTTLALSAASAAAMAVVVGLGFLSGTHTGLSLLKFVGLTTVAGPQSATLFVFTAEKPPLGVGWVIAMSTLNMAATMFLIIPLAWRSSERLRDNRFVGGVIRWAERFGVKHRRYLAKWGLWGLVVVTILPVQGAGVLGAGVLGVLLRIPLKRLLATIFAAGAALNLAWTVAILLTSTAMPTGGAWSYVPYAVVGAFILATVAGSVRGHLRRFRFQAETVPGTPAAQRARLRAVGIVEEDLVMNADLREVCRSLGIDEGQLSRARNTTEILRLDNLPPDMAELLTAAGIVSIRDVSVAPAAMTHAAVAEVVQGRGGKAPPLAQVQAWREEAVQFQIDMRRQQEEELPESGSSPS